ncbi:hypothetical protein AB833_31565 [Chromatiales bacterium (ex Bugula neritina AB1)]|nr:hypothetical protein AB833_31565 [Chromatiales bacterium (ex Bugula neritina AB1)]
MVACAGLGLYLLSALSGCSSDDKNSFDSTQAKLITRLEQQNPGAVTIRVNVNGRENALVLPARADNTMLQIPASLLENGNNAVDINFVLQRTDRTEVSLARASQSFSYSGDSATIVVQGSDYSYPDDDQDALPNLVELLIRPADIDNDGIENFIDTDSDADDLPDQNDAQPYGPVGLENALPAIATVNLQRSEETPLNITIDRIVGAGVIASALDLRTTALPLLVPGNWPWSVPRAFPSDSWQLIELPLQQNGTLCPLLETAIDIDTSSLQISVSQTVLGYFERFDGTPFSVPIESGSISNLEGFTRNDNGGGNGSLDNALRAILVPVNTVGFISLWVRAGFGGDQCQINLATPPAG